MSELRQRGVKQVAQIPAVALPPPTDAVHPVHGAGVAAAALPSGRAFVMACLLLLLPIRCLTAMYMPMLDCDETFNYWEPLHYLMFGRGLQTWEYSPLFGLRSYAYLWLISPAAWMVQAVHTFMHGHDSGAEVDKLLLFYAVRLSFAVTCALIEVRLLRTVWHVLGQTVARWMLLFLALSAGMSHAAPAFLPQTFTMMAVMLTLDAWMVRGGKSNNRNYRLSIFFTGVASLVGWPFSVLLSVPLALEVLWVYRGRALLKPIRWGLVTAAICVLPCLLVDFAYFRRLVFAVVNIAVYNSSSTSEHGANLYGKEPASFYFINLALNFNVAAGLALITPILLLIARLARRGQAWISELSVLRWLLPFYLWLGIFLSMPHKEERFLFVVYPYLALSAAVSAFIVQRMLQGCFSPFAARHWPEFAGRNIFGRALSRFFKLVLCVVFVTVSLSRATSLLVNYRAPLQVWTAVHDRAQMGLPLPFPLNEHPSSSVVAAPHEPVNVCVGKEWYRFPTTFFLPTTLLHSDSGSPRTLEWTLRFLDSDFGGLLPKEYLREGQHIPAEAASQHVDQWHTRAIAKLPADVQHRLTSLHSSLLTLLSSPSLHAWFPHLRSRPGTHVPPTGMNDLNRREDAGRFLPAEQCHYIVDLALPAAAQREPLYEQHRVLLPEPAHVAGECVAGWRWRVVYDAPFLDAASSPCTLMRAFWIPRLSAQRNVMRPYQLLERVPIPCASAEQTQTGGEQSEAAAAAK